MLAVTLLWPWKTNNSIDNYCTFLHSLSLLFETDCVHKSCNTNWYVQPIYKKYIARKMVKMKMSIVPPDCELSNQWNNKRDLFPLYRYCNTLSKLNVFLPHSEASCFIFVLQHFQYMKLNFKCLTATLAYHIFTAKLATTN